MKILRDIIDSFRRGDGAQNVFERIYAKRSWRGRESASGRGSDSDQTAILRAQLPPMFEQLGITSLLDLPCGDFNWMKSVVAASGDLRYIGGDIVPDLVATNASLYGSERISFQVLDLLRDPLPAADLLFCRDCLVHLSEQDVRRALANVARSDYRYVAFTTFTQLERNRDIRTGRWRPLNLCAAPFDFPPPMHSVLEGCTEENGIYNDKSILVWRLDVLRAAL